MAAKTRPFRLWPSRCAASLACCFRSLLWLPMSNNVIKSLSCASRHIRTTMHLPRGFVAKNSKDFWMWLLFSNRLASIQGSGEPPAGGMWQSPAVLPLAWEAPVPGAAHGCASIAIFELLNVLLPIQESDSLFSAAMHAHWWQS